MTYTFIISRSRLILSLRSIDRILCRLYIMTHVLIYIHIHEYINPCDLHSSPRSPEDVGSSTMAIVRHQASGDKSRAREREHKSELFTCQIFKPDLKGVDACTERNGFSNFVDLNQILVVISLFLLATNEIQFGVISIGKV